jgi:hypothetical protein
MPKILWDIIQAEGIRALFKGVQASVIGVVHPIVFFPAYEKLKIYFRDHFEKEEA